MTSINEQIEARLAECRKRFYESCNIDREKIHEKINQIIDEAYGIT